ncbi:MAG: tetratricopeptide repeat protein [Rhodospirillaceae bacterium]
MQDSWSWAGRMEDMMVSQWAFPRKAALALLAGLALSACEGAAGAGGGLQFGQTTEERGQQEADLALAALAKGDYPTAERHVTASLQADQRNPYGLLAAGILYQNTGRTAEAARAYQDIMALRPQQLAAVGTWFRQRPQTITDIAASNLEILSLLPNAGAETMAVANAANPSAGAGGEGQMMAKEMMGPDGLPTTVMSDGASGAPSMMSGAVEPMTLTMAGDRNRVMRFAILEGLLREGLITANEYRPRRTSNLGALLLMTQPPPAAGLERDTPSMDQVTSRLRALRTTFENKEITADQYAAERLRILENLLPAASIPRAGPVPPPSDLRVAADMEERIRAIRSRGLITEQELAGEVGAIQNAARGIPSAAMAQGGGQGGGIGRSTGALVGAHLASYKSDAMAMKGWEEMRKRYPELGQFQPAMRAVQVQGKGTFIRLVAQTNDAASLCRSLKGKGLNYCMPVRY